MNGGSTTRKMCTCTAVLVGASVVRGEVATTRPGVRVSDVTIRIAAGFPESGEGPPQWRVPVVVRSGRAGPAVVTPVVAVEGGRLVSVYPASVPIDTDGAAVFFVRVKGAGMGVGAALAFGIKEAPGHIERRRLACGLDLSQLTWEASWQGRGSRAGSVKALPSADAKWNPIRLPAQWEDLGVTWVRARFAIPTAWKDRALRIRLRAVDDEDVTFLNGQEIGRTAGWDLERSYVIPADLVRWGGENELCIAVDNGYAGGGIYRTPLMIAVEDGGEATGPFPAAAMQPEAERAAPGAVGSRLPLRPMIVRDGILMYSDGGEVVLWGVNTYPQSWTQFNSLKKIGVDPRRAVDEDFEDFVRMGIDIIRIHVFDTEISDGAGNLVRNEHLDVLDYLVHKCNENGIYLMLTPIAWWGSPNARPDSFSRNTPKQAMSLWPTRWSVQAEYLRQLLMHKNPYTGRRLVDDPPLTLFEIINEPTYWTYGDVMAGSPGKTDVGADVSKQAMGGVQAAWLKFLPSPEWRQPAAFACFRYDTLRRYINTMVDAIRSTGARQPIAYSSFDSSDADIAEAIADSRCNAITLGAYQGGLSGINDGRNLLPEMGNSTMDSRFISKARLVYEFDFAGMIDQVATYPAIARRWRNLGVQVACQFQYDARCLAHVNWDWPIHYLNLWHTPGKTVSFLIGGEAFRRIPRGAVFPTPDDDQVFPPAAVSFHHKAAVMADEDCYMQTGPTDWRPLGIPRNPRRILSVGSCPFFDYDGTGIVDLRIEGSVATLRIYPDVERLRRELSGTVERPLTRLHSIEHVFRLRLERWADAAVERSDGETWTPVDGRAGGFRAAPGTYRITRKNAGK